jgi:hypothetical protein
MITDCFSSAKIIADNDEDSRLVSSAKVRCRLLSSKTPDRWEEWGCPRLSLPLCKTEKTWRIPAISQVFSVLGLRR